MSERTRRYLPLLKQINRLGDRAKRQLIKKCDIEFLDCVSECAKNVIKGNVPLKPAHLWRLRRERSNVRVLASKKTSLKKKRRILQKGGFLSRCSLSTRPKRSGQLVIGKCKQLRSWCWSIHSFWNSWKSIESKSRYKNLPIQWLKQTSVWILAKP